MKRFLNLVVYILTIHVSALLIAGLFRLVLFYLILSSVDL